MIRSAVIGCGSYSPEKVMKNADFAGIVDTSDEWIVQRTGIRQRHIAADGETTADLGEKAARAALEDAGIGVDQLDMIILATSTPDHLLPPSGPLVAHRLGLARSGAIDMAGACAGFLYALAFADAFARTQRKPVLVIAGNILSRRINPDERASAVLFADAAGAVVVAPTERQGAGMLGCELAADGSGYDLIKIPAGGSRTPFAHARGPTDVLMAISDGRAVFVKAVDMMATTARTALVTADTGIEDIAHWIPHQANTRIIEATRSKLGIAPEHTLSSVALYGNSSAATIPFTLSLLSEERRYRRGERVLFTAAGAGLTGGAIVWKW